MPLTSARIKLLQAAAADQETVIQDAEIRLLCFGEQGTLFSLRAPAAGTCGSNCPERRGEERSRARAVRLSVRGHLRAKEPHWSSANGDAVTPPTHLGPSAAQLGLGQ